LKKVITSSCKLLESWILIEICQFIWHCSFGTEKSLRWWWTIRFDGIILQSSKTKEKESVQWPEKRSVIG